jgi:hypothetical protein
MSNVLVSSFELLFARQIAQVPVPNSPVNTVSRRVVQGYFLTLANLEKQPFTYRIELQMTPQTDPAGPPLFVKRIGTALSTPGLFRNAGGGRYTTDVTVGALETALLGVFPPTLLTAIGDPAATEYQSRGFVSISLPFKLVPVGRFGLRFEAQSKQPVQVLVTPDLRGTFLPNNFSASNVTGDFDFDQTFATLPVASGNNVLSVPPTQPFVISQLGGAAAAFQSERLGQISELLADLTSEEQAGLLQALVSSVDDSAQTLEWLNTDQSIALSREKK